MFQVNKSTTSVKLSAVQKVFFYVSRMHNYCSFREKLCRKLTDDYLSLRSSLDETDQLHLKHFGKPDVTKGQRMNTVPFTPT